MKNMYLKEINLDIRNCAAFHGFQIISKYVSKIKVNVSTPNNNEIEYILTTEKSFLYSVKERQFGK